MAASAATTPTAGATVVVAGGAVSGGSGKRPATKHKHTDDDCDVIGELMGQYGKYQFVMTFLLSLFQVPNTFHIASSIYQVSLGNWRVRSRDVHVFCCFSVGRQNILVQKARAFTRHSGVGMAQHQRLGR